MFKTINRLVKTKYNFGLFPTKKMNMSDHPRIGFLLPETLIFLFEIYPLKNVGNLYKILYRNKIGWIYDWHQINPFEIIS